METVAEAMLRQPTVHPADLTVGEARAAFAAHPKTHLLLLVHDDVLVAALTRDDLSGAGDEEAAAQLGSLAGRTTPADVQVEELRTAMADSGLRRIAVVDEASRLLGLLCLKASLDGFCTDEGVRGMRDARGQMHWSDI